MLSVTDTEYVTTAPAGPVASTVMSSGTVNTGNTPGPSASMASCTVTVKLPLAVFPDASVAVQSTVVVPSGNVTPHAGAVFPTEQVYRDAASSRPGVYTVNYDQLACPYLPICVPAIDGELVFYNQYHLDDEWLMIHRDQIWTSITASGALDGLL